MTLWLALPALSRYFGLHDATVATIACVTGAAGLTLPACLQFISDNLMFISNMKYSYLKCQCLDDPVLILGTGGGRLGHVRGQRHRHVRARRHDIDEVSQELYVLQGDTFKQ